MIDQNTSVTKNVFANGIHRHFKCISWTAIFAGALVGMGLGFLLHVFSMAIGLGALSTSTAGLTSLAVGGFLGMLVGTTASMFFMGWVSGYLARGCCNNRKVGVLYGFIAWCLSLIGAILLSIPINSYIVTSYIALSQPTSYLSQTENLPVAAEKASGAIAGITNERDAAKNLAYSLFFTFFIFFVGALASCYGGYYGLQPKDEE